MVSRLERNDTSCTGTVSGICRRIVSSPSRPITPHNGYQISIYKPISNPMGSPRSTRCAAAHHTVQQARNLRPCPWCPNNKSDVAQWSYSGYILIPGLPSLGLSRTNPSVSVPYPIPTLWGLSGCPHSPQIETSMKHPYF
jgi:hypothetical protein